MSEPASEAEKETITTHELLERSARAALELQREDGSFPPGRNGVYDEPETPVRTTSHWLTTLSKAYEITGDEVFSEAANDAADYLLSDEARPYGYTFRSRKIDNKDKADGLIGQAAPLRALARADRILERPELYETATSVFLAHPFSDQVGLWEKVEIDGDPLSFDRTVNHQITFAAASTDLCRNTQEIEQRISSFLTGLKTNLQIRSDGIIRHYVRPRIRDSFINLSEGFRHWQLLLNEIAFCYYTLTEEHRRKEVGYHPINLYGLARLKQCFPDHDLWDDQVIDQAVDYVHSSEYLSIFNNPSQKYGSMLPGIQTAYALFIFSDQDVGELQKWIIKDIKDKFDSGSNLFTSNALDPHFQAATIYNLTTLPDINIQI